VAALVRGWWLKGRASAELIDQAVEEIDWAQKRNAQARKSHTKTTRRKLRQLGIKLTDIKRVPWNTT
jgi:hypothetical protein